jgi:hypothetical protein
MGLPPVDRGCCYIQYWTEKQARSAGGAAPAALVRSDNPESPAVRFLAGDFSEALEAELAGRVRPYVVAVLAEPFKLAGIP